jgi:hypothetical protein
MAASTKGPKYVGSIVMFSTCVYLCCLVYIRVVYSVLSVVLCSLFLLLFIVLVTLIIVLVTVHLLP